MADPNLDGILLLVDPGALVEDLAMAMDGKLWMMGSYARIRDGNDRVFRFDQWLSWLW